MLPAALDLPSIVSVPLTPLLCRLRAGNNFVKWPPLSGLSAESSATPGCDLFSTNPLGWAWQIDRGRLACLTPIGFLRMLICHPSMTPVQCNLGLGAPHEYIWHVCCPSPLHCQLCPLPRPTQVGPATRVTVSAQVNRQGHATRTCHLSPPSPRQTGQVSVRVQHTLVAGKDPLQRFVSAAKLRCICLPIFRPQLRRTVQDHDRNTSK